MWEFIHSIAGIPIFSLLILSGVLYFMGYISPRTDGAISTFVWVIAYLDDTHYYDAPVLLRTFELAMAALSAAAMGKGGPKRPRRKKKILKILGAKSKAALAKLKASMPKVSIPRIAPTPA